MYIIKALKEVDLISNLDVSYHVDHPVFETFSPPPLIPLPGARHSQHRRRA